MAMELKNGMPSVPTLVGCVCFGDEYHGACMCGPSEMFLRAHTSNNWHPEPLSAEQRAWCLDEIDGIEGYQRADYESVSDRELARGVLDAWRDYCRDTGIY